MNRLGIRSEASGRFERGVDPYGMPVAQARFCELLAETCPQLVIHDGAVDARHDARERRRGIARQVMGRERQLLHAVQEHREAVRGRDGQDEGVQPGLERLVAQEPQRPGRHRGDRELLERPVPEDRLDADPQLVGRGARRGQEQDRLGRRAVLHQDPEALHEQPRLARARAAEEHERASAVAGRRRLRGAEAVEGFGHPPRI